MESVRKQRRGSTQEHSTADPEANGRGSVKDIMTLSGTEGLNAQTENVHAVSSTMN